MDFAFAQICTIASKSYRNIKKSFEVFLHSPVESESFPLLVVTWCFASQDMPTCEESEIFVTKGNDSEAKIFVDPPGTRMGGKLVSFDLVLGISMN